MMSLINEREVVFLVVSCDRYSDLWTPFFTMMQKMWPDCPYRQYLMTNEKDFVFDGVTVIKTGPDVDYSSQVRRAVEQVDSRWLILWLEDCIISRPVDTARLQQIVSAACAAGGISEALRRLSFIVRWRPGFGDGIDTEKCPLSFCRWDVLVS